MASGNLAGNEGSHANPLPPPSKQKPCSYANKTPGTSSAKISPWSSIVGVGLIGFGFTIIFQSAHNYLVDTFTCHSASALAANTFLHSVSAGPLPLFAYPMFQKMVVDVGSTVFAGVAATLLPTRAILVLSVGWRTIRAGGQWSKLRV